MSQQISKWPTNNFVRSRNKIQASFFLVLLSIAGCHTLTSSPDPKIISKFSGVDSLIIKTETKQIKIDDPAVIQRLKTIYEQAKWKTFRDTMSVDTISIKCMNKGEESFRFLFTRHSLLERKSEKYGYRKSVLDEESSKWLRTITKTEP